MPLLDFSEIPPASGKSTDTEAFEKFAKDFFVELRGAKIIKTIGRGPDGGADLVVTINDESCLVSCKHYLGGSYIPPEREADPEGRMKQWGCQKFIAFYSPGPTSGLEQKLRQTQANHPTFVCEILDSGDIEREMIATASPKGWVLAMRWFPSSFARIASSLVLPLQTYSSKDVIQGPGHAFVPDMGFSIRFQPGNDAMAIEASELLMDHANETATADAFSGIFRARIEDFARLVPGSFAKNILVDDADLASGDIFPSWDIDLVRKLAGEGNRYGLRSLCRIWSLWNLSMAKGAYLYGLALMRYEDDPAVLNLRGETSIAKLMDCFAKTAIEETYLMKSAPDDLSLSRIAVGATTAERGYFASLLCFCPGDLHAWMDEVQGIVLLARHHEELQALEKAAWTMADTFDDDDKDYVRFKSPTISELLVSLKLIDIEACRRLAIANPGLRCLSESPIQSWKPGGDPPPFLGKALGFVP